MTYLGNTPTTQNFISGTDYFNGTGSQTAFTLSRTVNSVNDIQVVVNNVVQQPNDAYTLSGTTLTMTSAPSAGTNNVYVRYLSTTTQAITPSQGTVSWNTLDSNIQQDLGVMYKNRIINGNMVIDQRNNGASINSTANSTVRPVDRFFVDNFGSGTVACVRSSTAPVGFSNSLSLTVSSPDTPAAGDYLLLSQQIEGFNAADLNWGTSNAKTITLSFWIRSSVTGVYGAGIRGGSPFQSYPFSYTISSANTWEYKTVTIPGPTSGTFDTTNGAAFQVMFDLGSGTDFAGTANTWQSGSDWRVSGSLSWVSNSGATLFITGVQLEVGTQATAFSTAGGSYGAELALCQRYYQIVALNLYNGNPGASEYHSVPVAYLAQMRATPSVGIITGGSNTNVVFTALESVTAYGCRFTIQSGANSDAGYVGGQVPLSAEL